MPLSTRNLSGLVEPLGLEALCKSLAMLDAIMSPDWRYRYFLYDPDWGCPADERMASLDNGSGDGYFLVFSAEGSFLKGFDHESYMTPWANDPLRVWPGVLEGVPASLHRFLNEPAFDMASTSFCLWWDEESHKWTHGPVNFPADEQDPDGSQNLLWMLDGKPDTYVDFGLKYYEKIISVDTVAAFYASAPLTGEMVANLNAELLWHEAVKSAQDIGYPVRSMVDA